MTSPCIIRCEDCAHYEAESCVGLDSAPKYPTTTEMDKLDIYIYTKLQSGSTIKGLISDLTNMLYEDIICIVEDMYDTDSHWDDAIKPIKETYGIKSML